MRRTDVVELLLFNKADVNVKGKYGKTPLHWAAYLGNKDVAALLLANKADVNAKDQDGKTPLRDAVDGGHDDVAALLREHGGRE